MKKSNKTVKSSTKDPREESLSETLQHVMRKDKYLITYEYNADKNEYTRYDTWTNLKKSTISRMGYDPATKFHDKLRYAGVKTFVRMVGFEIAPAPNKETSSTLAGFLRSKALDNFEKGLRQVKLPELDKRAVLAMIPIIIGAILGIYFLFGRG